jgi:anti-sigma factor RsiW
MIHVTDEMLNSYLDGELSSEESNQVKAELLSSDELQKRLNTLKLVNNKLYGLKEDEVSAGFTDKVMGKIGRRKLAVSKQQKYFIFSIAAFITILCLVILGFSISTIISASSAASGSLNIVDTVDVISTGLVNFIKHLFSGKGLSILGSIFSLVIIISGYFFFEMQKRSKANLGNGL